MTFNGADTHNKRFSNGAIAHALEQKIEHCNLCWCELKFCHGSGEVLMWGFPSIADASLL